MHRSRDDHRVESSPVALACSVSCLGEALVLLPADAAGGTVEETVEGTLAGAEVNVAVGLAALGVPVAWVGRLGTDRLGEFLYREIRRRGVDVSAVQFDSDHPTGSYRKQVTTDQHGVSSTRMVYRRAGSAASTMGPAFLGDPRVEALLSGSHLIHCSGITAALSTSCAQLMRALLRSSRPFGATVCFDVNWREQLWPTGDTSTVAELAGMADVALMGTDEAQRVFGTEDPSSIRSALPRPEWIVLKDGARRALAIGADGTVVDQPALHVDVVEAVGAGDAFAAGFLAGMAYGEDIRRCLRRGHLSAATVLTVPGDSAPLPAEEVMRTVLSSSADEWAQITVGADGVTLGERSDLRNPDAPGGTP